MASYRQELYNRNRERELEYSKQYRIDNLDEVREKDRERSKIYREHNLEQVREKDREKRKKYVAANKDKVDARNNQKNICECGGKYLSKNKCVHVKSKKHIQYCAISVP